MKVIVVVHPDGKREVWPEDQSWDCIIDLYELILMALVTEPVTLTISTQEMSEEEYQQAQ